MKRVQALFWVSGLVPIRVNWYCVGGLAIPLYIISVDMKHLPHMGLRSRTIDFAYVLDKGDKFTIMRSLHVELGFF